MFLQHRRGEKPLEEEDAVVGLGIASSASQPWLEKLRLQRRRAGAATLTLARLLIASLLPGLGLVKSDAAGLRG